MKRVTRLAPLVLVLMMLSLNVADIRAGQELNLTLVSLEELFDAARLSADYERKGWSPPGVTKSAVPGLEFLTKLSPEDKAALIAFLRTL